MPSPKIVIPSHKRADLVKAKDLVHDPIICVAESQLEEYQRYNPECEIVTHPDSVVGLIPKRNWMAKHFGDLFMLDDDVYCCRRIFIEAGESQPIHDKDKVTQIIYDLHDMAELLGVHLYGFTSKTSPMMFDDTNWLRLDTAITGCSYGVIANENTVWNESIKLKEDFWISCWMKYKERMILTDHRFVFDQKGTFVSQGGLAAIRNQDEEQRSILFMRKSFGDTVHIKSQNTNGREKCKQVVKYNISVNFRY